ncbi:MULTISPECIES: hypothetical protein [Vibrio]|uniref:Uncharacterized protein n=2 Tax=Vibrio TaxID=662 RepID=A0A7X4RWV5_9VIBR|nr:MULTISPECIES: hypothetical protein [Vibrio]MBF9002535.1 hypothetical protein [Vibrio nitrifigilis]MZI96128.1 hypothetical protein [Vibrio eleionomae]
MKVVIEYDEAGLYRDNEWDTPTICSKGQTAAVSPAAAAHLIKTNKAHLWKNERGELQFSN